MCAIKESCYQQNEKISRQHFYVWIFANFKSVLFKKKIDQIWTLRNSLYCKTYLEQQMLDKIMTFSNQVQILRPSKLLHIKLNTLSFQG